MISIYKSRFILYPMARALGGQAAGKIKVTRGGSGDTVS